MDVSLTPEIMPETAQDGTQLAKAPMADVPWIKDQNDLRDGGFSPKEIEDYKNDSASDLINAGFSTQEIKDYFGIKEPDTSSMKDFVNTNLQKYVEANKDKNPFENAQGAPKQQTYAKSYWQAFQAGFGSTGVGMYVHGGLPDQIMPGDAERLMRLSGISGSLAGDILPMMLGSVGVGTAAGIAAPPTAPAAAAAGAFALPAALRQIMMDHYQKGDITTSQEFFDRLTTTTWEAAKGATLGLLTMGAGTAAKAIVGGTAVKAGVSEGLSTMIGETSRLGAEATTMAAASRAMEGQAFNLQDVLDATIVIGGLHATGYVAPKMMNIYAKTGEMPGELVKRAEQDPVLRQELLSENKELPLIAEEKAPSTVEELEAKNRAETPEGEEPKPIGQKAPERSDAEKEILSRIVSRPDAKTDGFKARDLVEKFIDDLDPIKQAAKASQESSGVELSAEKDPYTLARNYRGWSGVAERALKEGTIDYSTGEKNGEGFQQILKDVPNQDMNGLSAYLVSKRVLELDTRGIQTPFKVETAREVVEQGTKFQDVAERITNYRNRLKSYLVDAGILDPNKSAIFDRMNENYVPFQYLMEADPLTGKVDHPGAGFFRKIEGTDKDLSLINPIQTLMQDTSAMIKRAEKNRVMTALTELPNSGEVMKKIPNKNRPIKIDQDEIRDILNKQGVDTSDLDIGDAAIWRPQLSSLKDNEFVVMKNGKREVWAMDKDISDAVKALDYDPGAISLLIHMLKPIAALVRFGITGSPGFGGRDLITSEITAGIQTKHKYIPFTGMIKSIGQVIGKGDAWNEFLSSGGANGSMERIHKILEEKPWEVGVEKNAWNVLDTPKKVLGAFRYISELADNATRIAEFQRSGGTVNRAQAALNARDITVDFSRVGSEIKRVSAITPFLNAGIQGTARTIETIKNDPARFALHAAKFVTLPSIAVWAYAHNDSRYKNAPDWQRDLYWLIPTDKWEKARSLQDAVSRPDDMRRQLPDGSFEVNNGVMFRIKKPFEVGILMGSLPERLLSAFKDKNPRALDGFLNSALSGVLPNILPPGLGVPLEQATNHSFFTGQPIVSSRTEQELPQYQYTPYTSEVAKQLGRLIGAVPLLRDVGGEHTKLASPEVIDNYIAGWSGTLGKYAVSLVDSGLHAAGIGDTTSRPEKEWADIPFVKEFLVRNASMQAKSITDFYDQYSKTSQIYNTMRIEANKGNIEEAIKLGQTNQDDMFKLDSTAKAISAARKTIQGVYLDKNLKPEEKRQLINSATYQAIRMAEQGNQAMEQFRKAVAGKAQTNNPQGKE